MQKLSQVQLRVRLKVATQRTARFMSPREHTMHIGYQNGGGIFENIVEFDATNIRNIVAEPEVQENARYAVNGRRLIAPVKGINLVKYNNGRVKKEIVK